MVMPQRNSKRGDPPVVVLAAIGPRHDTRDILGERSSAVARRHLALEWRRVAQAPSRRRTGAPSFQAKGSSPARSVSARRSGTTGSDVYAGARMRELF